jgi:surface antigen
MKASKLVATAIVALGTLVAAGQAGASQANPQAKPTAQRQQAAKPAQRPTNVQAQPVRANQASQTQRRPTTQAQRIAQANPGGISCVPYVRQATGMAIRGNGGEWWHNAAGLYARGHTPEPGAILAFPRSGTMRAGHVAVVQEVISAREILIHHANWAGPGIRRGSIMQDVSVIDVSLRNDWSSVRVQVGRDQESLGRIYPIQGFIYDRPDNGYIRTASTPRPGGAVLANARSLRPDDVRGFEELAQAPARTR